MAVLFNMLISLCYNSISIKLILKLSPFSFIDLLDRALDLIKLCALPSILLILLFKQ